NANGSSCAQRYRSYDPVSGTFLGYDGHRHPYE
ncbi:MAG TPA: BA14K family protein, partial [Bradyrhizobium sp.]|nr:BA14K family protein [Bradyrhizobium sp.]